MLKNILAACLVIGAAASAHATTLSLSTTAGNGWKDIIPSQSVTNNSYPSSSPINSVGGVWEAANTGWNSSASYNDSGWTAYSGGWADPTGLTPFYARKVFNIAGTVTAASFTLYVDDDSQLWVNGTLVYDDHNLGTGNPYTNTTDITSFLHSGDNVIAFKAHNSAGGGFGVYGSSGSVTYTPAPVSEPAPLLLAGLASFAMLACRRKG